MAFQFKHEIRHSGAKTVELVAANRNLITRSEQKIHVTLARVWGEDEPAPVEA